MFKIITLICLLFFSWQIKAQTNNNRIPKEYLVVFESETAANVFFRTKHSGIAANFSPLRRLSQQPCIYQLKVESTNLQEREILAFLQGKESIQLAQYHHYAQWRTAPNDPKYSQWQWNLDSIDAPEAWEYTKGGLTANGDTIVVAVVDGGCDVQHEDLQGVIWHNRSEIPNNNIDDDNNGWIDDYAGWRVGYNNDQHLADSHGTSVASIIGAVGDNGIGMTGINWQVKLMLLSGDESELVQEANIVEAYAYILDMRRRYNSSHGADGAFVVATNASLGVNYGQPTDYPIWCAIYDSLGKQGVLSVGATINGAVNVDAVGDMPTACPSDYLVAVTQSMQTSRLHPATGYGKTMIDLAAPGAVYAARPNNTYNVFGGTSGAAPHITGAIALLASYKNTEWATMLRQEPDKAALLMKTLLLQSTKPGMEMEGKSVSGGILNIGMAMKNLEEYFIRPTESAILNLYPNPATEEITLQAAASQQGAYKLEVFDMMGKNCFSETIYIERAQIWYKKVYVSDWNKGVYTLRLSSGKEHWARKWVKTTE